MGKGKGKEAFETFDSGSGPVIPEKSKGDFSHQDSDSGLQKDANADVDHGAVPQVPQK